jgi:hypothetical protein
MRCVPRVSTCRCDQRQTHRPAIDSTHAPAAPPRSCLNSIKLCSIFSNRSPMPATCSVSHVARSVPCDRYSPIPSIAPRSRAHGHVLGSCPHSFLYPYGTRGPLRPRPSRSRIRCQTQEIKPYCPPPLLSDHVPGDPSRGAFQFARRKVGFRKYRLFMLGSPRRVAGFRLSSADARRLRPAGFSIWITTRLETGLDPQSQSFHASLCCRAQQSPDVCRIYRAARGCTRRRKSYVPRLGSGATR